MISGYQLKGIKNFKPFSLIGFALAFFCLKTYFTENYDIKNDFVEISGKIKNSELIIKPKYKYLELRIKEDFSKVYNMSGSKLNLINDYENLADKIYAENQIFFKILKNEKDKKNNIEIFSLKSNNTIYLNIKDSIESINSHRKFSLWLGIIMILISLFLLTGINIIIDKNGITVSII